MEDKIRLFSADIDVKSVLQKVAELKKELEALKSIQDQLKKSGETSSEMYNKLSAQINNATSNFKMNQQVLGLLVASNGNLLTSQQRLDIALAQEVATIAEARQNTKELNKLREQTNTTTQQGKVALEQINDRIAKNNVFIKENQSVTSGSIKANQDASSSIDRLDKALNANVSTITQAREANKELIAIRNGVDVSTKQGKAVLEKLNSAIDDNTKFIKDNASEMEKQRMNIGNYKDSIEEAFGKINLFNGGLLGFMALSKEAGGAGNLLTSSFKGIISGLYGMVKASLAFMATGIGAVLLATALVVGTLIGSFKFMTQTMSKTEEGADKLNKMMSSFTGVIKVLQDVLKPLAEFIFNRCVKAFETLGNVAEKTAKTVSKALRFFGFDAMAESVDNYTQSVKDNIKQANELSQAESNLSSMQRESLNVQAKLKNEAEKLKLVRDDETKSVKERINASLELSKNLQAQMDNDLSVAKEALRVAELRVKAEGETTEALDKRAEAQRKVSEMETQILVQQSKQAKAHLALIKQFNAEILDNANAELSLLISKQGIKAKSLQQELDLAQKVHTKKLDIAKKEWEVSKKTATDKLKYQTAINNINNELLQKQTDLTIEQADRELAIFKKNNEMKLLDNKFYSDQALNDEQIRLQKLLEYEQEYWQKKLDLGVINQQQYNDELNTINRENQEALLTAQKQHDDAQKSKQLIDLANKREADTTNRDYDLKFHLDRLEEQRLAEIAQAERTGADTTVIDEKYAKRREDIELQVMQNKLSLAKNTFGNITNIVGENTALGKTTAIAEATIDMLQSSISAFKALSGIPFVGPALGVAAAASAMATGGATIAKIKSTPLPKAEKGAMFTIGGKRHSAGGTKFYGEDGSAFEAEQGEKMFILNRKASAVLAPLLSQINQKYGGVALSTSSNYLASGGQVLRSINNQATVDYKYMADTVAQSVAEASLAGTLQGSLQGTSEGTFTGITQRQTSSLIGDKSTF